MATKDITNGLQRLVDSAVVRMPGHERVGDRVNLQSLTSAMVNDMTIGNEAVMHEVRRTIQVTPNAGLHIAGASMRRTVLIYTGTDDKLPIFDFPSCRDTMVEDLTILVRGKCSSVFRYYYDKRANAGISTHNNRRRVTIIVEAGGSCRYGVEFVPIDGDDEAPNNEANVDEQVHISNIGESVAIGSVFTRPDVASRGTAMMQGAGWRFAGRQCKQNRLRDCRVNGNSLTPYGVYADGGSFVWDGGGMAGMIGANFLINEPTDPCRILDCDSDPSRRFLVAKSRAGRSGDTQAIEVAGGRFMTPESWLDADGHAFVINNTGPFHLHDFQLGSGKQRPATICLDALGPVQADIHSVQFDAFGSSDVQPVIDKRGDRFASLIGNTYRSSGGEPSQPTW